jgi:hypothetical protein
VASERPPAAPSLSDQVTRLYELIAGYHATHLIEIARELGVWQAVTSRPGLTSEGLATAIGTDPFYTDVLCRTAFSFGLLERQTEGWRMAPHFDQILGDPDSSFYLARRPGSTWWSVRITATTLGTSEPGRLGPIRSMTRP